MRVWGGHSCPPPLRLILLLSSSFLDWLALRPSDAMETKCWVRWTSQNQEQHQQRRTRVSAPHRHSESSALPVASSIYAADPDPDTASPIRWQTGDGRSPGQKRG